LDNNNNNNEHHFHDRYNKVIRKIIYINGI